MKIHVLLCSHNGGAFISDQLESILAQTCPVDDIHVHDYASHDRTREIVQSHATRAGSTGVGMIHLCEHQNAPGAALSFLKSMAALAPSVANDDLVLLCDQDDVWLVNKVEKVVQAFRAVQQEVGHPSSLLICHNVKLVDRHLTEIAPTFYTGNPFALPRDLSPDRVLLANPVIGHTMALSGALLRHVVALAHPECYLMHDWAITLTASRTGVIHYLPEILSLYRQHDANIIGASGRRSFLDNVKWVFGFSEKVVQQACAFFSDTHIIATVNEIERGRVDRFVFFASKNIPVATYFMFALLAFFRGPTLKRRLLGVAFLAGGCGALLKSIWIQSEKKAS